jgi:hypothetical protein
MKRLFIFLVFTIILSCNGSRKRYSEELKKKVNNSKEETAMNSSSTPFGNLIEIELVFKIPIAEFYSSNKIVREFKTGEQSTLGMYVPISFDYKDGKFYLPNPAENKIQCYSKQGMQLRKFEIPKEYGKPRYFSLIDSHFVFNSYEKRHLYEITEQGNRIFDTSVYEIKHSVFGDNILYQDNHGVFHDKKHSLSENIIYDDISHTYDFLLIKNKVLLTFLDKDLGICLMKEIGFDGNILRDIKLSDIKEKDYFGVNIIGNNEENYFVVASSFGRNPLLAIINKDNLGVKYFYLKRKDNSKDPLIGENAMVWAGGIIFKYIAEENAVYSLETDPEFIIINKYSCAGL